MYVYLLIRYRFTKISQLFYFSLTFPDILTSGTYKIIQTTSTLHSAKINTKKNWHVFIAIIMDIILL